MATEVLAYVFGPGKEGLTAPQMSVALSYANHAHKDGTGSFPGTKTVMEETRLSERSVQRARSELVAKGVLELEQEATGTRPARYCFPAMRASSSTPARGATVTPLDQTSEQPRGVTVTPLEPERGATQTRGGATQTPRGVTVAGRGVTVTPKPSLTINQPSEEPTSRARERGSLTVLRSVDERDTDDLEREAEERAGREWERTRYLEAANGGEDVFSRWERQHKATWEQSAARAGLMPNRMPQAAMPRSSAEDYAEATG